QGLIPDAWFLRRCGRSPIAPPCVITKWHANSEMTGKRLFVAIELPESTKRLLVVLDPQIHGVRWLNAEQMHLTLGFFADVPEDVDLKLREKLTAIVFGAFFLPIVGVGTFPPKGPPTITWIG